MHKTKVHSITDNRGGLVSLESGINIPFDIKRVYYLYNLNDEARGFHAHLKLRQFLICVSGSCTVKLDDGETSSNFTLNDPTEGIFVERLLWREMHNFSKDCVLLVIADAHYDECDYIRNYEDFLKLVRTDT